MKKATVFLLCIFPLVFISCATSSAAATLRTITVSAQGSVEVKNALASISVSVVTRNDDVLSATKENSQKMDAVRSALIAMGLDGTKIVTIDFSIWQETSYENGRTVYGQYQVTNSANITSPSIDKVGEIIDAAVRAGANRFNSIGFSSQDTREAEKEARLLALRAAEEKALTLATASGCELGKVVSIAESPSRYATVQNNRFMSDEAGAAEAYTPISGGQSSVTVGVEVTYEIK